jgi:hypothetical protein
MFYHMTLAAKELLDWNGRTYEIAVYRVGEDGSLRGYVSVAGFSDQILGMTAEIAYDMKTTHDLDAVAFTVRSLKDEISSGKFHDAPAA